MQREQRQRRDPRKERVGVEQGQQRAGELALRVDRDAVHHVREGDAPEQGRDRRADEDRAVPPGPPAVGVVLAAVLECDAAHDQRDEDQEEREVEAGEERRIPGRERRERRAAGGQQPDLVAVPDRSDRVDDHAPVVVVLREERQEDADPEVEALEHEVPDPEDRDQREPENLEVPVAGARML